MGLFFILSKYSNEYVMIGVDRGGLIPNLPPCGFKEPLMNLRFTTQELIVYFLSIEESIVCDFFKTFMTSM